VTEKPLAAPSYQLLLQKDATLLAVGHGGASKDKVMARLVGYLTLTRKYYGNAKASHEAT
jgi:hypothetical protein